MLGGDPRRIRMAYSLLFSLPGTPTLFYGEEIGMGEDLDAEGRMAVRTPMQWTPGKNGGFSTAAPSRLVQRMVPDGYAPEHVNAADQLRDPDSHWSFMRSLIVAYRDCPEIGWGDVEIVEQPHHQVLAHQCVLDGSAVLAVHNLAAEPVTVVVPVPQVEEDQQVVDVLNGGAVEVGPSGRTELALEGYGFRWLRVRGGSGPRPA